MARKKQKFALADEVTRADGSGLDQKVLEEIANVEAEFVDIQNYRRKQTNNLLGVFQGDEYIILDEMRARLLDIPKKFDRFEGNSMYASATLGSFVLNFRVDMDIAPDFCEGKLFFIEIESGVAGDSKLTSQLDEVLDIYDPEFRAKLDERWHIYYGGESPKHDSFLENYMRMQLDEVYFCRELVDVLSQLYVTRMIAYVATMGEKGEKIEREFKELSKKYVEKDPDFSYKHELQKEILDKVLKGNNAMEDIVKTEDGRKILQAFSQPLKNVRDKTYPSILTEDLSKPKKKVEEKTEAKPKSASSGGGSKKSGGGGKKAGKKYVPPKPKLRPIVVAGNPFIPIISSSGGYASETPKVVSNPIQREMPRGVDAFMPQNPTQGGGEQGREVPKKPNPETPRTWQPTEQPTQIPQQPNVRIPNDNVEIEPTITAVTIDDCVSLFEGKKSALDEVGNSLENIEDAIVEDKTPVMENDAIGKPNVNQTMGKTLGKG